MCVCVIAYYKALVFCLIVSPIPSTTHNRPQSLYCLNKLTITPLSHISTIHIPIYTIPLQENAKANGSHGGLEDEGEMEGEGEGEEGEEGEGEEEGKKGWERNRASQGTACEWHMTSAAEAADAGTCVCVFGVGTWVRILT